MKKIFDGTISFFKISGCYLAVIFILLLKGIVLFFAMLYYLWCEFQYQVKCFRYPPPAGGMFGNMARGHKNKKNKG